VGEEGKGEEEKRGIWGDLKKILKKIKKRLDKRNEMCYYTLAVTEEHTSEREAEGR
jgi:hypothetical protein